MPSLFPSNFCEAQGLAENLLKEVKEFHTYLNQKQIEFNSMISKVKILRKNTMKTIEVNEIVAFIEDVKMYLDTYVLKSASILYGIETKDTIEKGCELKKKDIQFTSILDIVDNENSYYKQLTHTLDYNDGTTNINNNVIFTRHCMGWLEYAFYCDRHTGITKKLLLNMVSIDNSYDIIIIITKRQKFQFIFTAK